MQVVGEEICRQSIKAKVGLRARPLSTIVPKQVLRLFLLLFAGRNEVENDQGDSACDEHA